MYEELITKIETTLGLVSEVKEVFSYPKTKITKFPAVFFKPNGMKNSFETGSENMKIYRFLILVMIGVKQSTHENVNAVLAKTVDAVIAQFDADWNQGTIEGHRVWVKIDSADAWQVSEEQDGLIAYAPLSVEIKLLSTN